MSIRRLLIFLLLLLGGACTPFPGGDKSTSTRHVALPTSTLGEVFFTPTPTAMPGRLTICATSEPTDLFIYGESSLVKQVVFAAIYDGPIEWVNFRYQPVLLEKLPSLMDGDAILESVPVQAGDWIVDAQGSLTQLQPGVRLRPAGCRSDACAVVYEGGTLQMDRLRVLFRLRPGIFWEDGEPLLAYDSVFSYQVASNPETLYGNHGLISSSPASLLFTASYIALNDLTVQWTGLPGFLDPNYALNFFSPLPEHILAKYPLEDLLWSNEVLYRPAAWGAYRVVDWQAAEQIVLQPNPYYFRRQQGLPAFEEVVIRFIGSDAQVVLEEFRTGGCDLVLPDALPVTLTSDLVALVDAGEATLVAEAMPVFEYLVFNVQPAEVSLPSLFADRRMRQAVAACLDRAVLTDVIYAGFASPLNAFPLLDELPDSSASPLPLRHDPERGRALLEQVGWRDIDGDGIREAVGVAGIPDGTRLAFALYSTDAPLRDQIGYWIALQLKACGMEVVPQQASTQELFAQEASALIAGRRFQMAELSAAVGAWTICERVRSDLISMEANGWSGTNVSGYVNPQLDAACVQIAAYLPGTPEHLAARQEMARILEEDLPFVPLFLHHRFWLTRPNLTFPAEAGGLQQFEALRRKR